MGSSYFSFAQVELDLLRWQEEVELRWVYGRRGIPSARHAETSFPSSAKALQVVAAHGHAPLNFCNLGRAALPVATWSAGKNGRAGSPV